MTNPKSHEPATDHLTPVDETIHQAREGSWHLPPGEPGPVHEAPPVQATAQTSSGAGRTAAHAAPSATAGHAPTAAAHAGHSPAPTAADAASHGPTGTSSSASTSASGAAAVHSASSASGAHLTSSGHAPPAQGAAASHGSGHDDAHGAEPLGPVDVEMWGAGIVATAIGLFMAVCFVLATSGVGAY
jgi:hypothetical protein